MLLIKTNSKSAFTNSSLPKFTMTDNERSLLGLGVSSWVESGDSYIRKNSSGVVTGLADRANGDILKPNLSSPTIINSGLSTLRFNGSPMYGNAEVLPDSNIQTIITVQRMAIGTSGTILGNQATSNEMLVYVDSADTSGVRFLQNRA